MPTRQVGKSQEGFIVQRHTAALAILGVDKTDPATLRFRLGPLDVDAKFAEPQLETARGGFVHHAWDTTTACAAHYPIPYIARPTSGPVRNLYRNGQIATGPLQDSRQEGACLKGSRRCVFHARH